MKLSQLQSLICIRDYIHKVINTIDKSKVNKLNLIAKALDEKITNELISEEFIINTTSNDDLL